MTAVESPHDLSQAERGNALFLSQTGALQPPTNLIGAPSFSGELVDEKFPPEQRRDDVRQVGQIDRQVETIDLCQGRIVPFQAVWNPTRPLNDIADNAAGECVEQTHVHRRILLRRLTEELLPQTVPEAGRRNRLRTAQLGDQYRPARFRLGLQVNQDR